MSVSLKFACVDCTASILILFIFFLSSAYQVKKNNTGIANFDEDLEVMEKIIDDHITESTGSIMDVFSGHLVIKNKLFPMGWKDMNSEKVELKGDKLKAKDVKLEKHGARLLLLFAYIMTTNVLDDRSNEWQM
jgi:hypothetical protein